MQFSSLFTLLSLLLIQSEVTHATFVCKPIPRYQEQTSGICASEVGGSYILTNANRRDAEKLPYNFTCEGQPGTTLDLCCKGVVRELYPIIMESSFLARVCHDAASPNKPIP